MEVSLFDYNHENGISSVVSLAYLSARDRYHIEREESSSKGRADYMFHPITPRDLPIVVEVKRNKGVDTAIDQILEKEYANKMFRKYKRDVLIVGIDYTEGKDHTCKVMRLEYKE